MCLKIEKDAAYMGVDLVTMKMAKKCPCSGYLDTANDEKSRSALYCNKKLVVSHLIPRKCMCAKSTLMSVGSFAGACG